MDYNVADLLGRTKLEARPYQSRLIHRSLDAFFNKNLRSVMIESPTGSGKTATALCIAKALQNTYPDLAIGWISMRRNLLLQAERENVNKAVNANIKFISMFEKTLPIQFIAGTEHAAPRRMLIVDEAQHDAANSMAHIHAAVNPQFILGMTATPFRTDSVKLCFDTVLKDAGLATLIKDGYLSSFDHYTIPQWSVKTTTETYLREPERWGASIFYYHRVEHCFQALQILENAGISAEVVTGSSDREAQITRFHQGETRVLINCMVLTEGFDAPNLKTVFCRPSCKGVTIQMCGRAFRKHVDVPRKQIVQAKKGWPFVKLVQPVEQYTWDKDRWMALKVNPRINELNCQMMVTLASVTTEMPEFFKKAALKARGRSRRRPFNS